MRHERISVTDEAAELNQQLKGTVAERLLSRQGVRAYYPKSGIPGQTMEAKGTQINATLGQAFDDERQPLYIPAFAKYTNLDPKEVFPYAPTHGITPLREFWQKEIRRKNPSLDGIISLPVATSGLAHGLTLAQQLFIDEYDMVTIFAPFWGNYKLHFEGENEQTIWNPVPLYNQKEKLNLTEILAALSGMDRKHILSLTFPSNPTGYTPTEAEAEDLFTIIKESAERNNDILVICDDAYFGLTYEKGLLEESPFARLANIHENVLAVKVDGATKEAFFWGARVGFLTYGFKGMTKEEAKALEDKTAGRVRGTISGVCTGSQHMVLHGMQDPLFEEQLQKNRDILQGRVQTIKRTLEEHPEWREEYRALPFNSGYFMCLKTNKDTETVRKILRMEYNTGVLSINNMLRIAHAAVPEHAIPELYENIYQACKKVS